MQRWCRLSCLETICACFGECYLEMKYPRLILMKRYTATLYSLGKHIVNPSNSLLNLLTPVSSNLKRCVMLHGINVYDYLPFQSIIKIFSRYFITCVCKVILKILFSLLFLTLVWDNLMYLTLLVPFFFLLLLLPFTPSFSPIFPTTLFSPLPPLVSILFKRKD